MILGREDLKPFKAWFQKTLPLAYDDSLTYQELLYKLIAKINEVVESQNQTNENFDELYTLFIQLKEYVDNYFKNLDVQEEINNKLDEMAADGTLDKIINEQIFGELNDRITALENPSLEDSILTFNGFSFGMRILKAKQYISQGARFKLNNIPLGFTTDTGTSLSATLYQNLDMPIKEPVAVGTFDQYGYYLTNVNKASDVRISFRVGSPYPFDSLHNSGLLNLMVTGFKTEPPTTPQYGSGPLSSEALAVAKTYLQAREDGRRFTYAPNFIYYSSNAVNDSSGDACMECDTLVFMIMSGIPYDKSPYATTTPNYTYDFANLTINPNSYKWALNWKNDSAFGGRITNTSSMMWYGWNNKLVYVGEEQVQTGDIACFRRPTATTTDNIGHVGFIELVEENNKFVPYIYHVSTAEYSHGNILDYCTLEEFYNVSKGRYLPENTIFMRPNYTQQ